MENNLVFVSAHPDIPYFHWQTKVYTNNFIEKGIKPENIHVLFVMVNGNTSPTEESLKMKDLGINIHHYLDDRKDKKYIPSLRPLALSRWLKEYPELGKYYFYHDSDIIFRQLPDFDKLLQDDVVYLSDTLIKNTDYTFWEKVFTDCEVLYRKLYEFNMRHRIPSGDLQIWTADMWAVLWNLWRTGHETRIVNDLSFSWATDTIATYEKHPILHMAGVTEDLKPSKFYKGEFINVNPLLKLKENPNFFDYIEKNSSTIKYIEQMKNVIKNEQ